MQTIWELRPTELEELITVKDNRNNSVLHAAVGKSLVLFLIAKILLIYFVGSSGSSSVCNAICEF